MSQISLNEKAEFAKLRDLIAREMSCPHDHVEDTTPAELRESAYRRGYHQATHAILELLKKEGLPYADVLFYEKMVYNWRFRHSVFDKARDKVERPPQPGQFEGDYFESRRVRAK